MAGPGRSSGSTGQRFLHDQHRVETVSQLGLFQCMTHVACGSAQKIWTQDSSSSTLLPTESKDDTQPLPMPSLQVPYLGTIGPGKSLEVVPARPQDRPKEDPVGAQEWTQGLTWRLNSNVYINVKVKTLLLILTSSRPEKIRILLQESPGTPGMKGNRGILIHFPF